LIVLAVLSLVGGFIELPHTLGHFTLFSDFLAPSVSSVTLREGVESSEWTIQIIAAVVALSGIYIAYLFYIQRPSLAADTKSNVHALHQFLLRGWDFDALYDTLLVRPFVYLSAVNKHDVIDRFYAMLVTLAESCNRLFVKTQSGLLRWYLMGIVVGAILILTLGLFANL
jgi:NADH-quinone oxidoreductase subunit L